MVWQKWLWLDADRREHPELRGQIGLDNIIKFQTRDYQFPIMANVDFGHDMINYFTLPNGVLSTMDTARNVISLDESAVE